MLFSCKKESGNKENAKTAHEMGAATEQMQRSIAALQRRSSRVGLSALKLNSLVGQFQVTAKQPKDAPVSSIL